MLKQKLVIFVVLLLLLVVVCGCISRDVAEYQGGNLSRDFYLTREVTAKNYKAIPVDAGKFTIGEKFIELDNVDGKGKIGIMISRYVDEDKLPAPVSVKIDCKKFDLRGAKLYFLDKDNDLTVKKLKFDCSGNVCFKMAANSVIYIEK